MGCVQFLRQDPSIPLPNVDPFRAAVMCSRVNVTEAQRAFALRRQPGKVLPERCLADVGHGYRTPSTIRTIFTLWTFAYPPQTHLRWCRLLSDAWNLSLRDPRRPFAVPQPFLLATSMRPYMPQPHRVGFRFRFAYEILPKNIIPPSADRDPN